VKPAAGWLQISDKW